MFFLDIQNFKFKHDHCTREKQTNMSLNPLYIEHNLEKTQ